VLPGPRAGGLVKNIFLDCSKFAFFVESHCVLLWSQRDLEATLSIKEVPMVPKLTEEQIEEIEDAEDIAESDRVLGEIEAGRMEVIPMDVAFKELGLEQLLRRKAA
jgi:hypothetical protein